MSCASWMGRTLLFRVASGTKFLGVSSNHDLSKDKKKTSVEAHYLEWLSVGWSVGWSDAGLSGKAMVVGPPSCSITHLVILSLKSYPMTK